MGIPININDLLNSNIIESSRIEYKADYNPSEIIRTICAFANDIDNMGVGILSSVWKKKMAARYFL